MSNAKLMTDRRVRTGEVRLSYAHLIEPRTAQEGQEPKYSVSLVIPKSDTETIKLIKQAIQNAAQEGIGKFGGKIPNNLQVPLRDGDIEREDDGAYTNAMFVNANATLKNKPTILKNVGGKLVPAEDDDVYSGVYACVTIEFFAYNFNGKKGVGAGLGNILILRDGEPLSGGATAEDDFGDIAPTAASEFTHSQTSPTGGFGQATGDDEDFLS